MKIFNIFRILIVEKYQRLKFYINLSKCFIFLILALVVKAFAGFLYKNREIWIIGENTGETLNDNGYFFFKYCCDNIKRKNVYFLSNKSSIKKDLFLNSNKNVIAYSSFKHLLYLLSAKVFIYSQSHRDIIYDPLFKIISINRKIVSLKHGVFGLKKAIAYFQRHCNEPDILTVVSDYEKSIIYNSTQIEEKRLKITGLARFDYLKLKTNKDTERTILYVPTWRDWIKPNNFYLSKFYKAFYEIINDDSLIKLLNEKRITLMINFHKHIKKYTLAFESINERIKIVNFGQKSMQELFNESHMLITDYSSVSWDFYYVNKPVIFYQFDIDDYLSYRGSYLDLKKELFGDSAHSKEELIQLIKFYINTDFKQKEKYSENKINFFKYSDQRNCERIFKEICNF